MQTLSLEDEIKRIDGVPYTIDFYQDLSKVALEDYDNRVCIPRIIKEIMNPKVIDVQQQSNNLSLENKQQSEDFWNLVDREMKKEAKREKKWKKHHKKVSAKQAYKNLNHVYKKMIRG